MLFRSTDTAGGVAAGLINAGLGDARLRALGGNLTSATVDGAADIVGSNLFLDVTGAGSDVGSSAASRLEINATTLNASTSGNAGDDIFVTDTASGVAAGFINAGLGNVYLTSAGAINDANGATNNISASTLNAQANNGISLDTNVNNITAQSNVSGDINLKEANAVTLDNITDRKSVV